MRLGLNSRTKKEKPEKGKKEKKLRRNDFMICIGVLFLYE
jgi:hypothetical protein